MPVVGVEPTLLTERDFESRASANSATPAALRAEYYTGNPPTSKRNMCLGSTRPFGGGLLSIPARQAISYILDGLPLLERLGLPDVDG